MDLMIQKGGNMITFPPFCNDIGIA